MRNTFYTAKEKSSPSEFSKVGDTQWHPQSAADSLREIALTFFMCFLALKSENYLKRNILVPKGQRVSEYLADLNPIHAFYKFLICIDLNIIVGSYLMFNYCQ